jgi:hypothetical protein
MHTTSYAASIKPFQRTKNGRAAWLALTGQYAGPEKWEAEIKHQEQLLHTRVWKGQGNFTLEKFIAQHHNAFVSMQACAEHITYQLPNEFSRVGLLLDAIQCNDAGLQAAMASIRTDTGADGMRYNFETSAAHLLQYDPVAKKRAAGTKRPSAEISVIDGDGEGINVSSFGTKPGIGKTGVHFRYHTIAEYRNLSNPQKEELKQWRKDEEKKGKQPYKRDKDQSKFNKAVAAAVNKQVAAKLKSMEEEKKEDDHLQSLIASIVQDQLRSPPKAPPASPAAAAISSQDAAAKAKSTLVSILKKAKNGVS